MSNQRKGVSFALIIVSAVLSCLLGIFFAQKSSGLKPFKPYQYVGSIFSEPRSISDFELSATNNTRFNKASLKGKWTLVFYGFTHCQMMCPTAMNKLAKFYAEVDKTPNMPHPQVVMVSIDPKRDSLTRMKNYLKAFNPNFIGARGDVKQVQAMTKEFGIAYMTVKSADGSTPANYDIQHSGALVLLSPKGELKGFINWPYKVSDLVADYKHLVA